MNDRISTFLSLAVIIILFGYISFNESARSVSFSDEGTLGASDTEFDELPYHAVSLDLPDELSFAGESVPMQVPDVRERLDKELQINSYLHSNTLFLIKRANRWLPQMEPILAKYEIPDDFKYLPLIESNLINAVSPKQAVGYWQILRESGKEYGLEITSEVDERYDPIKATEAACKYLRKAYAKFGNWTLAAASYNRGMAGLERALENQKVNSYYDLFLNDETSRYIFRILAIKEIIEHPDQYGFRIKPEHLYPQIPLRYVEVHESVRDLVDFAQSQGANYKLIKEYNPWLRDDKLTVKKGKSYRIALPV